MAKLTSRPLVTSTADATQLHIVEDPTGTPISKRIAKSDLIKNLSELQFNPSVSTPSHSEGLLFYDQDNKTLSLYVDEAEVTLQIGQEMFIRVYNDSGGDIDNGEACYLSGIFSSTPTVDLAQADAAATCLSTIGIATHLIEDGTYGYITNSGVVRDVSTTGFNSGDKLFLSATTPGGIVNTPPTSPNYLISLGQAVIIDGSVGTLQVNINVGTNTSGVIKIFNGSVLEDSVTTVTSDGATVTLIYQKNPTGDLSVFFNGSFSTFDSTDPVASIALTAGSDTAPTLNYIYILESTLVLTKSTVSFPTAQHVPVATVLVQSASSAQTDGVYKLHAWTDHLSDINDQGHLSHLNHWVRHQHATWNTGVAPTTSITVNGGAIDNVYFSNTSGNVLQLHDHSFPAIDMSDPTPIFAVNDDTTAYRRVTDLSTLDEDSTGTTLRSNNTYYSIVVFGVASEAGADSKIYCNLPSGAYSSESDANDDPSGYSNFSIPTVFRGVGFLIARIVLRYQTSDSGTITEIQTQDLRGLVPATAAGGAAVGGGTEFSDNLFKVFNVSDNSKELQLDLSGVTTSNTRVLSVPDRDGMISTTGFTPVTEVSASTYTLLAADQILHVTYSSTGTCLITVPTALITDGREFTVIDGGDNAATNNITIETQGSEQINFDSGDFIIDLDKRGSTFYCFGNNIFRKE